jgi:hypothetical protein
MSVISDLALKTFQTEFDGDTGVMYQAYIQAWMEENLGQLNTLLYTSYSGIDAELDLESQSIYRQMYLGHYYKKQARNALKGIIGSTNGSDILSLRDSNSAVTFTNKNEVAKVYKSMADECDKAVTKLVAQYNMYQAQPNQLGGIETTIQNPVGVGSYYRMNWA